MTESIQRYWKYLAIFLILVLSVKYWQLRTATDNLFYYNVEVMIVDDLTGKPVEQVSTHGPASSSNNMISEQSGVSRGQDGKIGVSGIGYSPRKWNFSAPGYDSGELVVDDTTKSPITLILKKTKQDAAIR